MTLSPEPDSNAKVSSFPPFLRIGGEMGVGWGVSPFFYCSMLALFSPCQIDFQEVNW